MCTAQANILFWYNDINVYGTAPVELVAGRWSSLPNAFFVARQAVSALRLES